MSPWNDFKLIFWPTISDSISTLWPEDFFEKGRLITSLKTFKSFPLNKLKPPSMAAKSPSSLDPAHLPTCISHHSALAPQPLECHSLYIKVTAVIPQSHQKPTSFFFILLYTANSHPSQGQGSANFSAKGQSVNIQGSAGRTISITTIWPCCHSIKEPRAWLCSSKTLSTDIEIWRLHNF